MYSMTEELLTAENALLGACLLDSALWRVVLDGLHRDDLFSELCRAAYDTARRFDLAGGEPPLSTDIADAGVPRDFLFGCMEIAAGAHDLDRLIAQIRQEARRRALAEIGDNLAAGAREGADPATLTADLEQRLSSLDERDSGDLMTATDVAAGFYDFRDRISGKVVRTGIAPIDRTLGGGLLPSGLYLAARPGCGKTALALQIADSVAQEGAVLFVSLEMDASQLQARRISRQTGISSTRLLLQEQLSPDEWKRVQTANTALSRVPLCLNGRASCSVQDVRTMARKVKDLRLVVVDYLGLLRPERSRASRYEEVSGISNELKALARSLRVPVLCLAQLNRATEQRADKRPMLSDLRDSGAIEQDADSVLLMHRPDLYAPEDTRDRLVFVATQVAKNRHGGTASFELGLHLESGRFVPVQGRVSA